MAKLRTVSILFFCLSALFISKTSALNKVFDIPLNDTLILAVTKKGFTLKKGHQKIVVPLKIKMPINIQRNNYSLLLESVQVDTFSEGIYEVFLSPYQPDKKHQLSVEDDRFIGLLDLYSLSNKAHNKTLSLAILDKSKDILNGKKKGDCYYLVIQFSGNVLPNGNIMPHVSHLSFRLARIIQY